MDQLPSSLKAPHSPSKSLSSETERKTIAATVSTLLSHYWTGDEDPRVRALQIADWVSDLQRFGGEIVSRACAEWRTTETRRPVPADLYRLCCGYDRGPKSAPPRLESPEVVSDRQHDREHDQRVREYEADMQRRFAEAAAWRDSPEGREMMAPAPNSSPDHRWRTATLSSERLAELIANLDKRITGA